MRSCVCTSGNLNSAVIASVACAHLGDVATLSTITADPRLIFAPSLNPGFAVSRAISKWTEGDLQGAFDELDPLWETLPPLGNLATLHGEYVTDRAELAVQLGHADAAAIVEHARASILSPVLVPGVRRLDLLLAPLDRIDQAFKASVVAHGLADDGPFAKARTDLVYGQRLHAGGREHEARAALARALERFTAAGADPWCAATLRQLDELGTVAAVQVTRASERLLTPAEERVAQVVANGATTREAASLLFLSPKTIEMHLSRIYRKLSLRNRTELARLYSAATLDRDR